MASELRADYECWIILCVTHLLWSIHACVSCLFAMYFHCCVLNKCCFIPNEHCITRKCSVRPQYLSSPQESGAAGFGRPNGRQGVTKCWAPDSSNKCRHPFRVQTAWGHCSLTTHTACNEWQTVPQNLPEGLELSGRPAPGTKVLDFFAISFCNSLPFLLLNSVFASSRSCHVQQNRLNTQQYHSRNKVTQQFIPFVQDFSFILIPVLLQHVSAITYCHLQAVYINSQAEHKHTMLHVWNEINSGIAQFSATHDNITVQFFIIQTNKHTAYTYINNNILYIVNTAIQPNLT